MSDKEILVQAIPASDAQDAEKSQQFTFHEHSTGFWQALRLNWPAFLWGLFINFATILKGIDGGVVRGLVGLNAFKHTYGYNYHGEYVIAAHWISAFNYANLLGAIVGALCSGPAYDRFGPRLMMTICSLLSIAFIFLQFFSHTPAQLFVGQLINGCIIAFYPICASAYVSEVTPLALRGCVASMTNLAFSIGSLIASGILKGTESMDSIWSYKIPIATQWIMPVVILSTIAFCPDPPYWLCRKGKTDAAMRSLRRLATPHIDVSLKLAHIQETLRLEAGFKNHSNRPNYLECFRGPDLRRLIICVMAYDMQAFAGNVFFISYAVHFMEVAGLSSSDAFSMNLGMTAIGLMGTCVSWTLLSWVGRRPVYLVGCSVLCALQLAIGLVDAIAPQDDNGNKGATWAQCGLMIACTLVYDLTLGPFCYVLLAEVSSARLRGATVALSTVSCFIWSIVFAVAIPYAMDKDEANWGGKLGFLFAGTTLLCLVYCFFCLPETKGRTFEELDILFERKVPSRKFKNYRIDMAIEREGTTSSQS
ncbi:hypothetical protein SI65_08965 [Aspergillus cristatus]|uniref:Major facilitator superfamily (MFS) profile domain-containing protein n=1 Tax=Aspergillus cristatus TaxID=573508 RepID=A0A1E3B4I7_ASPCR|nr:hypothetical protein SI65_08965 [Aspergillus cristatus]